MSQPVVSAADGDGHILAERCLWPWLPTAGPGHLARHAYCTCCGKVKAIGSGRGLPEGGLINLLATLKRRLRDHGIVMTDTHRRLILQSARDQDAVDPFTLTKDAQIRLLAPVVAHYVGIPPATAESYLRIC